MIIHALERKHYDMWLPLWQENCLHQITDDVTAETWRRLTNPKEQMFSLGFFNAENQLQGFVQYALHHTSGFIEPACYMQDLYVEENVRRQGIAKQLVWELQKIGKEKSWAWIYWFADNTNQGVQKFYENIGVKMDFSLRMLPTRDV